MIINQNVSGGGSQPSGLNLPLEVSSRVLQHKRTDSSVLSLTGVEYLDYHILARAYHHNTTITGTAFKNVGPYLTISDYGAFEAFYGCTGITSTGLDAVGLDVGNCALENCFNSCTGITSFDAGGIYSIAIRGMYSTFYGCQNLTGDIYFSSLTALNGNGELAYCFAYTAVNNIYFPALTEVAWNGEGDHCLYQMLAGVSNCTVHFPSDCMVDDDTQMGGTNIGIVYDLDPVQPEEPDEPIDPEEPEPEPEEPPFEEP